MHAPPSQSAMLQRFETLVSTVSVVSMSFGVFPMTKRDGMNYQFSWICYLYSVTLGLITCSIGAYWTGLDIQEYNFTASFLLNCVVLLFNMSTWAVVLIQGYLQNENTSTIILQLYGCNGRIGTIAYSGRYAASMIFMSLLNAIPTILYSITYSYTLLEMVMIFFYYIFINISVIMAGRYAILMNILSDQLASLTDQMSQSKFNLEVRNLVEIRHTLGTVAAQINKAFNIFLLQALTLPFIITVINVYIVIVCIVKPDELDDELQFSTAVIDAIVCSSNMVLIVTAATGAKNNAKDFKEQLFNNMLTSKSLGKDDSLKTYISMKSSLKQSACGFFTLDYPLLTSMVAGATTYVVLLVQFTLLK